MLSLSTSLLASWENGDGSCDDFDTALLLGGQISSRNLCGDAVNFDMMSVENEF
jgi:hypothetical protein